MIKNIERQTYDDALTDLLTVQEAATRLRLSARFVYRLCSNGELPHFRFGSSIRIDPIELEQYKQESVAAVRKRREERPIASKNRLSILKKRK
ncbi:helix-turn-helix domain-containing protein [Blastopirellula marina]|nr:helix-turn-helix domain-containing protein [Blastopirellula marina]